MNDFVQSESQVNPMQVNSSPPTPRPIGVLVAQLGTPDAPTPQAVRPYLRQFLSDTRVVDYPPVVWQPLLNLVILNTRPRRSARLYERIWTEEGSPLMVYSQAQVQGLRERLSPDMRVKLGMRYGNPSIQAALDAFQAEGIDRIVVLSMYPQFSISTTGSIYDAVAEAAFGHGSFLRPDRRRMMPALRFVPPYFDDPGYIGALAAQVGEHIDAAAPPEQIMFSFHGVPQRYVDEGDPYQAQCEVTGRLLAQALGLAEGRWTQTYQSRFGPEQWLKPATDTTLEALGQAKTESLLVACPGFTADCLETVDEIGHEGRGTFTEAGGGRFTLAPCLNAHPAWLDALAAIVRREAQGWLE
jgi:ferrochelatase